MKKVMKALALALALCMVLSVSAFAAELTETPANDVVTSATREVKFTIEGFDSAATEQVALLVLKTGKEPASATESDILYIDQKATSGGSVTFEATIAEGTDNDVVDVYVGSSTISNTTAWEVYPNLVIAEASSITFTAGEGNTVVVNPTVNNGLVQPGAAIKVNIKKLGVQKMIWVLKNAQGAKLYSKSMELGLSDAALIDGDVWFTGVFSSTALAAKNFGDIDAVNAIFLGSDGKDYFTDSTDAVNKEGYQAN